MKFIIKIFLDYYKIVRKYKYIINRKIIYVPKRYILYKVCGI